MMKPRLLSLLIVSVVCLLLVGTAAAQITEIFPPTADINTEYRYGWSIDLDGANNRAILGAYGEKSNGNDNVGAAFIYTLVNGTWTLEQKITSPDALTQGEFGWDVQIEGNLAAVSAPADLDQANAPGKVYIYENNGGTWGHVQTLVPTQSINRDLFGVDMQLTGDTLLIGAPGYETNQFTENSGAAYVFTRSNGTWSQTQQLVPASPAFFQGFGTAVAFQNTYMLIGSPGDGLGRGAVFPYTLNGTWQAGSKITASDGEAAALSGDFLGDFFGTDVTLNGNTAAIGAWQDRNNGSSSEGSVYVFSTVNGTIWTQGQKLVADSALEDGFGFSIEMVNDVMLVSADDDGITTNPLNGQPYPDGAGDESGALYVFKNENATWTQFEKLVPADNQPADYFGNQFATDGTTALVGAWGDDGAGSNVGSLYVVALDAILAPPQVTAVVPQLNQTDVRVNTTLSITFSKDVTPAVTSGITFTCNGVVQPFPTAVYNEANFTFTLTPQADLPFGATCVFALPTEALQDSNGQPLEDTQGAQDGLYVWTFTTEAHPQVIATNPLNNAVNVPLAQQIVLTTNEAVMAVGGGISLMCDGGVVPFTASVLSDFNYLLNTNGDLPEAAACVLRIPSTSVVDDDSNFLADNDGTADGVYTLTFFTASELPRIISTVPSANATDVSSTTSIQITVTEPLRIVGGGFTFACGGVMQPFPAVTRPTETRYNLQPRSNLPAGTSCTLTLPTASLADDENSMLVDDDGTPNDNQYTLSFTVAGVAAAAIESSEAPVIESSNAPVIESAD